MNNQFIYNPLEVFVFCTAELLDFIHSDKCSPLTMKFNFLSDFVNRKILTISYSFHDDDKSSKLNPFRKFPGHGQAQTGTHVHT